MPARARIVRRALPLLVVVIAAAVVVVFATAEPGRTSVVSSPSAAVTSPSPTLSPQSASPSPQTASPSPTPQPRAGSWIELRWSAPALTPQGAVLLDAVSWRDSFVAAADLASADGHAGAAFISADGLRWERTTTFAATPNIFATSSGLVAVVNLVGSPRSVEVWTSIDGRTWQRRDQLALTGAAITSLAARDGTIAAAGIDASGSAILWSSTDGAPWSPRQLPARGIARSVAAVGDGFVALGRDGEPDAGSGGISAPGVARPAAWTSPDGRTWTDARVEGSPAPGAQLLSLFQVTDGLFAIGSDATAPGQNARSPLIWSSADGRDWRIVGPPEHWGLASGNGRQAVIFYYADFGTTALGAWSSLDGRVWIPLQFTGDVADIPGFTPGLGQASGVNRIVVAPRGVVVLGQQNGQPKVWVAEAVAR